MKTSIKIALTTFALLAAVSVQAQVASSGDTTSTSSQNIDWNSASDLEVELQAIEMTTPTPANTIPRNGIFFSAQHSPISVQPWPPLPFNSANASAWSLGDSNVWLLDDLNFNYNSSSMQTKQSGGMMAMDDSGPPSPGDGGTNVYLPFTNTYSFDTNSLWLEITNITDGQVYLNLHHGTDYVYEVWSKTNLAAPTWDIASEVFPTDTNVMPFNVSLATHPSSLFLWARDWTGITSGGNTVPEWWFWLYFHTVDLSDSSPDSHGNSLWYDYENGLDPNVIDFYITVTNNDANTTSPTVQINILDGNPSYVATLVDSTNYPDATWSTYTSTNVTVNLGSVQGWHSVWVGLRGLPTNATPTWQDKRLKLDTILPLLVITNPISGTLARPRIQLQGYSPETLASMAYDITNAAGLVTNQPVIVLDQYYDTNTAEFITNYFQGFDIPLTNGLNTITLHATDMAGNTVTTNISYTLSYAGQTNPPVIQLYWPQNGDTISDTSFTLSGNVNDPTAAISIQTTSGGSTNSFNGLVGRDGNFWVYNLPLIAGTNFLTLMAVDAASNVLMTNIMLIQSSVALTVNGIYAGQTNASGAINATNYTLWVNGAKATQNGGGTWTAQIAPIGAKGGMVEATAIPNTDNGGNGSGMDAFGNPQSSGAISTAITVQPPSGTFISYFTYHDHGQWPPEAGPNSPYDWAYTWQDGKGGSGDAINASGSPPQSWVYNWPAASWPSPLPDGTVEGDNDGIYFGPDETDPPSPITMLHCNFGGTLDSGTTIQYTGDTQVKLATGGPLGSTGMGLYLISAGALEYLPPWVGDIYYTGVSDAEFVLISWGANGPADPKRITIMGQTLIPLNSESGYIYAMLPDNTFPTITPVVNGSDCYDYGVGASRVTIRSLTVVSNATEINATNWVTVKSANDYVYLQATVSNGDTNAAQYIQWSAGDAVPGNPFQRRVSKATSAETTVTASLGSSSASVNVWVIWGTISILTSGSNPSPLSFTNWDFPDDSPLGIQYYFDNLPYGIYPAAFFGHTNEVAGKTCIIATITPAGIHSVVTNGWDFVQKKMGVTFANGAIFTDYLTWTSDGPDFINLNKTIMPDNNDKLYSIDGPTLDLANQNLNSAEAYKNFYDYITWNSQTCCETNNFWSFQARWKVDRSPQFTLTGLETGTINIPTNSFYPPP